MRRGNLFDALHIAGEGWYHKEKVSCQILLPWVCRMNHQMAFVKNTGGFSGFAGEKESKMEIERKFLIDRFPDDLPLLRKSVMRQGYLSTRPVVRIRSEESAGETSYILCIKGRGTLVREEIELPIDAETFGRLEAIIDAPLIHKEHRIYELPGGEHLECNLVDGWYWYAEVEFPTEEAAGAFISPAFLKREVTEESGFSMGDYWRKKLGKD